MDRLPVRLSKSDYMSGCLCLKRLYLSKYQLAQKEPISMGERLRIQAGIEIGRLARKLYPDGCMISAPAFDFDAALKQTEQHLKEGTSTLFEAAFTYDRLECRVDILSRLEQQDTWSLIEVKSSSKKKPEHLEDLAFQTMVARKAGIEVKLSHLIYLNKGFIYDGNGYPPNQILTSLDMTEEVGAALPIVEEKACQMLDILDREEMPKVDTNVHCKGCPYHSFCHIDQPSNDVVFLPRIRAEQVKQLRGGGFRTIDQIPENHLKNKTHELIRRVIVTEEPFFSDGLQEELEKFKAPIHFIDFEGLGLAKPIFAGMSPYDVIPFQWSDHALENALDPLGSALHFEFLHNESTDPRANFSRTLYETIKDAETIVYYSDYEIKRLRELSDAGVPLGRELWQMLIDRGVDLLPIMREHVYHPDFNGSYSIKAVLPALYPGLGYSDLSIHDGETAAAEYYKMINSEDVQERRAIRANLLAYCKRDTEAMVALYCCLLDVIRNRKD